MSGRAVVAGEVLLLINEGMPLVPLLTARLTEAAPPALTGKVAPFVGAMVKLSWVAVTVRLTFAVWDVVPLPLGVPVTVMVCAPVGSAMLAAVVMVS